MWDGQAEGVFRGLVARLRRWAANATPSGADQPLDYAHLSPTMGPGAAPEAESGSSARRLVANASGETYVAYGSVDEARSDPDAALVMEGDWGGQIFLACPLRVVGADEQALWQLLRDLDAIAWGADNQAAGATLAFERQPVGSQVDGGMGGGLVAEWIWVHEEFEALGLDEQIRDVVRGRRARLDRGPPRSWIPWS